MGIICGPGSFAVLGSFAVPYKCKTSFKVSVLWGRGDLYLICFFFLLVSLFINLVISLFVYLLILIFINFIYYFFFYFINHR